VAARNLLKGWNNALHGSDVLLLESELLTRGSLGSLAIGRGGGRGGSRSGRSGAQIAVRREGQAVDSRGGLRGGGHGSSGWERWEDEAAWGDGREDGRKGEGWLVEAGLVEGGLRAGDGRGQLLALRNGPWRSSGGIAVEGFVVHFYFTFFLSSLYYPSIVLSFVRDG
jgi:hypothetical protein